MRYIVQRWAHLTPKSPIRTFYLELHLSITARLCMKPSTPQNPCQPASPLGTGGCRPLAALPHVPGRRFTQAAYHSNCHNCPIQDLTYEPCRPLSTASNARGVAHNGYTSSLLATPVGGCDCMCAARVCPTAPRPTPRGPRLQPTAPGPPPAPHGTAATQRLQAPAAPMAEAAAAAGRGRRGTKGGPSSGSRGGPGRARRPVLTGTAPGGRSRASRCAARPAHHLCNPISRAQVLVLCCAWVRSRHMNQMSARWLTSVLCQSVSCRCKAQGKLPSDTRFHSFVGAFQGVVACLCGQCRARCILECSIGEKVATVKMGSQPRSTF